MKYKLKAFPVIYFIFTILLLLIFLWICCLSFLQTRWPTFINLSLLFMPVIFSFICFFFSVYRPNLKIGIHILFCILLTIFLFCSSYQVYRSSKFGAVTPTTDPQNYQSILQQYGSTNREFQFFPNEIPANASNVQFYHGSISYGPNCCFYLYIQLPQEEIVSYQNRYGHLAVSVTDETTPQQVYLPNCLNSIFSFSFTPNFTYYIIGHYQPSSGHFGQYSYGFAIAHNQNAILFFREKW